MNDNAKTLEQRVAAMERQLKVSRITGPIAGGLLGMLLAWALSQQFGEHDVYDHFWVKNGDDGICVELTGTSRGGGLSVNNPDRRPLFKVTRYEKEELGFMVSVSRPDGSQPAVALHGREDGGEIIVWRGEGEKTSLWGGGVDADGEPVSVVERLVKDVADLRKQLADSGE